MQTLIPKANAFIKMFTAEQLQQGFTLTSITKQFNQFSVTLNYKESDPKNLIRNLLDMKCGVDIQPLPATS